MILSFFYGVCADVVQQNKNIMNSDIIYKKSRLKAPEVWKQRVVRAIHKKDSLEEVKADIRIQLHHLEGTMDFILQKYDLIPEEREHLETRKRQMRKSLQQVEASFDLEKLKKFQQRMHNSRKKLINIENQRKDIAKAKNPIRKFGRKVVNFKNGIAEVIGDTIDELFLDTGGI